MNTNQDATAFNGGSDYSQHELNPWECSPDSGLYVYSAKDTSGNNELKIRMSRNSRGVQLGETLTILTGGRLRATPH